MGVSEFTIRHLGPKGDGIHLGSRGRVYVERAIPGDRIHARIAPDADGIARGEIVDIVEPSPHRQAPPCPNYDRCGGCTLQHVSERFYRGWKGAIVRDAFLQVGLRPREWRDTVFLPAGNRRRATFSARRRRDRVTFGYYRRRSQEISEIETCLVSDPLLLRLRAFLRPRLSVILPEGEPVDFFVQRIGDSADLVITGPLGRHGEPDRAVRGAIATWLDEAPEIARIGWRAHEREPIAVLFSRRPLVATFGRLAVALPPAAFLQPTADGERALVETVLAAMPARGRFADLFAGCGTFAGSLLARGPVDAYESTPASVRALAQAAGDRPLRAFGRDLFRHPLRREELNRYDALVFDPPRAGCREQAARMATAKTGVLVGVSCNPATLARDARILVDGGYQLRSVQAVDQFLWSHHVEVVAVFTRHRRGPR